MKKRYNSLAPDGLGSYEESVLSKSQITYRKVDGVQSIMTKKEYARKSDPIDAAFQWQERQKMMKGEQGRRREFEVKELIDEELEDGQNTSIDIFNIKSNYFQ